MRKIMSLILVLSMIFSTSAFAFATEGDDTTFDVLTETGEHITAAVLVENGVARSLTETEYLELMNESVANTIAELPPFPSVGNYIENNLETMAASSFTPTSNILAFAPARRVSPLFSGAAEISVTQTTTFERSVAVSGGASITSGVNAIVDAQVSTTYGLQVAASSSISETVTGKFYPTGNYTYSAVIFSPRIAVVRGNLNLSGTSYYVTYHYPVTGTEGLLDGIYALSEANTVAEFPPLG